MGNRKPESTRLPTTAEEWWVRLAAEAPSAPGIAEAFERWKGGPGNAEAYAEVARLWVDMDAGLGDPQLRGWLEEAEEQAKAPASRRWPGLRRWMAAAALPVLLLAALPAVFLMLPEPVEEPVQATWQRLETVRGEVREVGLEDGSVLHLDTSTRVEVNLGEGRQRLLRLLEGRIRIDVGADPRPLRVHAGPLRIDHIGTVFDLAWNHGAAEVLLREGALQVEADDRSQTMAPGDRLLVDGSGWHMERLSPDVLAGTAGWVTGKVLFDDQPLAEVAQVLTSYGPRVVRVDPRDPAAGLRVSGVFQAGRQQAFLDALSHVYPVSVREGADGELELRVRH